MRVSKCVSKAKCGGVRYIKRAMARVVKVVETAVGGAGVESSSRMLRAPAVERGEGSSVLE